MTGRPPLPLRWESHLAVGLGSLLLTVASRSRSARGPDLASLPPQVRSWREARAAERPGVPWRARFVLEQNVVRGLTSLLLAWRSYRLEHGARRS